MKLNLIVYDTVRLASLTYLDKFVYNLFEQENPVVFSCRDEFDHFKK